MELGFIILRHVRDSRSKGLWHLSYKCIRKLYPENPILIIDDHSNYNYIDTKLEKDLINTTIIKNTKIGRGEILPYLYYLEHKIAEKIIFMHDSSFITKKIDVSTIKNFKLLWHFSHKYDKKLSPKLLNHDKLIEFMRNKDKWYGSTGAVSIISHDYLKKIDDIYDLKRFEPYIKTRRQRMVFERIIGIILYSLEDKVVKQEEASYFGSRKPFEIRNVNIINDYLKLDKKMTIVFTAPKIKNSYIFIFKKDPYPKKRKVLKITTVDGNSKKFVSIYKENTPRIYIQPNHTIESVYFGLRINMIEVTELFKIYITRETHGISNKNLGMYKLKVGR